MPALLTSTSTGPPKRLLGRREERVGGVRVGDVALRMRDDAAPVAVARARDDGDGPAVGGQRAGGRGADAARAAGDERAAAPRGWRTASRARPRPTRSRRRTRRAGCASPRLPASRASCSASGSDAGGHVAERSMQSTTRSRVEPEPPPDRLDDARVGLVVDEQVDVVERRRRPVPVRDLGHARRRRGLKTSWPVHRDDALAARRRTAGRGGARSAGRPGRARRPSVQRDSAPAPSAKSAAVPRSSGSSMRDRCSAPITSTDSARPDSSWPAASGQRGEEAGAGGVDVEARRVAPTRAATSGPATGSTSSGEHVATITRSRRATPSQRALGGQRGEVGEPLARRQPAPLADAGPRHDPVLVDAEALRDRRVGDDGVRQRDAEAGERWTVR